MSRTTLVEAPEEVKTAAPVVPRRQPPARRWRRVVSPVVLVLGWELAARTGLLAAEKLPAPSDVAGHRLRG